MQIMLDVTSVKRKELWPDHPSPGQQGSQMNNVVSARSIGPCRLDGGPLYSLSQQQPTASLSQPGSSRTVVARAFGPLGSRFDLSKNMRVTVCNISVWHCGSPPKGRGSIETYKKQALAEGRARMTDIKSEVHPLWLAPTAHKQANPLSSPAWAWLAHVALEVAAAYLLAEVRIHAPHSTPFFCFALLRH